MTAFFLPVHLLALALLVVHVEGSKLGSIAKLGCQEKCGNLSIPYPFGIGEDCYFAEDFKIMCEDSGEAILSQVGATIYQMSEGDIEVFGWAVPFFYEKSSGENFDPTARDFLGDHFSFSQARNRFVAIGCDIYAYLIDAKSNESVTGCAALCNSSDISSPASSSSCSGIRCCQASFPKDLTYTKIWMLTINTKTKSWSSESNQCGYVALATKDFSDFDNIDLSKCNRTYKVPMVLDWSIGNLSCQEAMKRSDYACHQNSYCVSSARGVGYQCRCSPGYEGNPYLPNGCKDINECETPKRNNCPKEALCSNTLGSYLCICPKGYEIDNKQIGKLVCVPKRRNQTRALLQSLGIGLSVDLVAVIAIAILVYHKLKKRKHKMNKKKFFERNGGLLLQQISSCTGSITETKIFRKEELDKATDNFSENRVLGKGGLGTVYKGMLSDGSIVAVKRSNKIDENQIGQFINEVFILSHINHRHIVKLLGCCLETEVPLLVYEYVSNGTLSNHLHDKPNVSTISWENRLRIATESAEALAYMHSHASTAIFHRDIKSSNILLDKNLRAVISDFGLSRSVPIDKSHLTTFAGGTFGYLDPEYFMTRQLNDRSDVYAFGVVLAELLTGRKAISSDEDYEGLAIQFQSSMAEGRLFEILERTIASEGQEEKITAVAELANKCMNLNARNRPGMKEVASVLEKLWMSRKHSSEDRDYVADDDDSCWVSERSYSCKTDVTTEGGQEYSFALNLEEIVVPLSR